MIETIYLITVCDAATEAVKTQKANQEVQSIIDFRTHRIYAMPLNRGCGKKFDKYVTGSIIGTDIGVFS